MLGAHATQLDTGLHPYSTQQMLIKANWVEDFYYLFCNLIIQIKIHATLLLLTAHFWLLF